MCAKSVTLERKVSKTNQFIWSKPYGFKLNFDAQMKCKKNQYAETQTHMLHAGHVKRHEFSFRGYVQLLDFSTANI